VFGSIFRRGGEGRRGENFIALPKLSLD